MGWFSFLKGSPTTVDKAVDNVLDKNDGLLAKAGGWFDRLHFTEEEKAEANTELSKSINEFVLSTMGENTARSITRRAIAVMWIKAELALILLSAICAPWNMDLAKFYWEMASSTVMLSTTLAIIAFFFGSHVLRTHQMTKKT